MIDIMIPTLTAHIDMLTTILGMPLNLLDDIIVVRLYDLSNLRLFLLLADFGLPLSSA
jgi:hypothetical protein